MYKLFGKEPGKTKVLVAMSGGVDSSLVAVLLKKLGYELVGCTLQLAQPSCGLGACCTGRDLIDVQKICENIGIPHVLVKARDEFKQQVIQRTVDTYAKGLTPSPCVWCNSKVRFDFLLNAALEHGCDGFVTGHYAYISEEESDISTVSESEGGGCVENGSRKFYINAGVDPAKDQSYFLSMLRPEMLKYVRFPLGNMHKSVVRRLARRFGIHVADKSDSQDLCFVKDTYTQTLWNLAPQIFKPGNIVNTSGEVVGEHDGVVQYTIGQRKGLGAVSGGNVRNAVVKNVGECSGSCGVNGGKCSRSCVDSGSCGVSAGKCNGGEKKDCGKDMCGENKKLVVVEPIYVVDIMPEKNEVMVGGKEDGLVKILFLENVNMFIFDKGFQEGMFVRAKVRARSETVLARLWDGGHVLEFVVPIHHPARGQFAIMYIGRKLVACGLIKDFSRYKKRMICV